MLAAEEGDRDNPLADPEAAKRTMCQIWHRCRPAFKNFMRERIRQWASSTFLNNKRKCDAVCFVLKNLDAPFIDQKRADALGIAVNTPTWAAVAPWFYELKGQLDKDVEPSWKHILQRDAESLMFSVLQALRHARAHYRVRPADSMKVRETAIWCWLWFLRGPLNPGGLLIQAGSNPDLETLIANGGRPLFKTTFSGKGASACRSILSNMRKRLDIGWFSIEDQQIRDSLNSILKGPSKKGLLRTWLLPEESVDEWIPEAESHSPTPSDLPEQRETDAQKGKKKVAQPARGWATAALPEVDRSATPNDAEGELKAGTVVSIDENGFIVKDQEGNEYAFPSLEAAFGPTKAGDEVELSIKQGDESGKWIAEIVSVEPHKTWYALAENKDVTGLITRITDGCISLEVDGISGFLKRENPDMKYNQGDRIQVTVSEIDVDRRRLVLASDDEQVDIEARKQLIGRELQGTVVHIDQKNGAFVQIGPGYKGLIHISEMAEDKRTCNPADFVSIEDRVEVKVLHIRQRDGGIAMALIRNKSRVGCSLE